MALRMECHYSSERIPTVIVFVPNSRWNIPIPQTTFENLHPQLAELAATGDGRSDKVLNLLSHHCNDFTSHIFSDILFKLRLLTVPWVDSLDLSTHEGRVYYAAAFPVLCIGVLFKIRVQQTAKGRDIAKEGSEYTGTLESWTVFRDETGTCTFKELKDKCISFNLSTLASDLKLFAVVQRPDWWTLFPMVGHIDVKEITSG